MGAVGAAIGTFFAELGVCITQAVAVRKEIDIKNYVIRSIPFIILGIAMFALIYFIHFDLSSFKGILLKILIGGAVYIVGLIGILLLNKDKYYNPFKKIMK